MVDQNFLGRQRIEVPEAKKKKKVSMQEPCKAQRRQPKLEENFP